MKCIKGMLVLATLALAGSVVAEEGFADEKSGGADHGIRVSLGNAPQLSEGEILGSTFDIDGDTGGQLEILYARRHWTKNNPNFAGIWGAGIFFAGHEGVDPAFPSDKVDLSAFGIMGQGGVAFRVADILVLEAQPYLGIGGANVEITGFTDGGAPYVMYGVKGGAFFTVGVVELGLELGYQGFSSEVELDFGGPTTDLTLTGSGLHASGVLAIKF